MDKYCAIIVDDRPSKQLDKIVEGHMAFLPGWDLNRIHHIPINSGHDYNNILLDINFWIKLLDYERVLIFQHDSMILRGGIEEFLGYDFIGAPIHRSRNFPFPAMNGGFSLRNPKAMIECIEKMPKHTTKYAQHNEDIYFSYISSRLGMNMPTLQVARQFSVETIYGLGSFGIHNIDAYLTKQECETIRRQYE